MEFYECCPIRHNGIKVLDNVLFRLDREDKVVFMGDEIAVTILFNILIVEEEIDASTFKCGVTACQSYLSKKRLLLRWIWIFISWLVKTILWRKIRIIHKRILIGITPGGIMDRKTTLEEY